MTPKIKTVICEQAPNHGSYFAYAANALLCLYSVAAWAQEIGTSFSVPFFRLSVGTDDRSKLLCALKPRFGALHTRFDDYAPHNE